MLRNRLGQMGIKLPLDALLIIAFQHHEKRRDILGSAVTRLPVERVLPPPPLATARTCNEYGEVAFVVPGAKPQIRVGTKLARWASRAGEPDSVAPEKSSTISPETQHLGPAEARHRRQPDAPIRENAAAVGAVRDSQSRAASDTRMIANAAPSKPARSGAPTAPTESKTR